MRHQLNTTIVRFLCISAIGISVYFGGCTPLSATDAPQSHPKLAVQSDQASYFYTVAFGAEYGDPLNRIIKWNRDPVIKLFGTPSSDDLEELDFITSEIKTLTNGKITFSITTGEQYDIAIYFIPKSDFQSHIQSIAPHTTGYVQLTLRHYHIQKGIILIASDIPQENRHHVIREEVTQSLGLLNDSWDYSDSIFYQGWSTSQRYSAIDKLIISLLYNPSIKPGMSKSDLSSQISVI